MKCLFIVVLSLFAASLPAQEKVQLANEQLQIEWTASPGGWKISRMAFKKADQWVPLLQPEGNYTLLYAAEKPGRTTPTSFTTVAGTPWPDTLFRYLKNRWADAATPVALNTAGTAFSFYPQKARQVNNHTVQFVYDAPMATVTTLVSLDNSYKGDLIIQQQLQTKKQDTFLWQVRPYFLSLKKICNGLRYRAISRGALSKKISRRDMPTARECPKCRRYTGNGVLVP